MPNYKNQSRQEYARKKQEEAMSGYKVTDMSPSMKKKYASDAKSAYDNAARDYQASTQFDNILNRSSMPIQGSGMRAMGSGMLMTPSKPAYDSKGKKIKGLK
jgi:hypothetical protein